MLSQILQPRSLLLQGTLEDGASFLFLWLPWLNSLYLDKLHPREGKKGLLGHRLFFPKLQAKVGFLPLWEILSCIFF